MKSQACLITGDGDYCLVAENDDFQKGIDPEDERIVGLY